MSPERDDYEEEEEFEEEPPRSIFAATWFRVLLVVIVLAVAGVFAVPYVLEWYGPSPKPPVVVGKPSQAPPAKAPAPEPLTLAPPPVGAPAAPPAPAAPSAVPPAKPQVAQEPDKPTPKPSAGEPAPVRPPSRPAEKPAQRTAKPAVGEPATTPSRGDYWVQVGAFGEAANAARLAGQLTDQKYSVQRATVTRPGGGAGGNEVFVAGASQRDLYDKVKDKGYRVDAVKGGAAVRPPLPLREAVALSRELAEAGMEAKIRRVGGGTTTVHVVRVGGFRDRQEAEAARKELVGKGVPGFVVKGAPR
ncbi:MAG: SPOR domain-containing protein [Candidatus Rokubacteria bacterium]|nr:SPOR domain-containing protein [Candidatus Rokubacteria bacterium]